MSIMLVVLIVIAVVVYKKTSEKMQDQEQGQQTEETGIEFPYLLDEGKVEVTSMFQYSGMNPDCNNEMQDNIVALSFTNTSSEYLKSIILKAVLKDETSVIFEAFDIPAGKSVMVFSKENIAWNTKNKCMELTAECEFETEVSTIENKIIVETEETNVIIENNSEEELNNLIVYCHCLLEEDYYGGLSYSYPIEKISVGEKITIDASDCYMGEATVVRVEQNKQN